MIEPLSLITALLLGLFGASHCLVMCGGIAAAVGSSTPHASVGNRMTNALAFNIGRISSYALAGFLVGVLGLWLQQQHQILMIGLRSIAGIMLILMGLYIARWASWLTRVEQIGQIFWRYIQPQAGKLMQSQRLPQKFALGMLWGWLPCGLIYSTLSWVAANGDPAMGALAMFTFGLGTFPALFASSMAAASLTRVIQHKLVKHAAGLLLIGYGCWTICSVWLPILDR